MTAHTNAVITDSELDQTAEINYLTTGTVRITIPDEHHATAMFMSVNILRAAVCSYLEPRCPIF